MPGKVRGRFWAACSSVVDGEQGEGAAPHGVCQLWDGCPCATCLVLGTGRDRGVLLGAEPGAEEPGVLWGSSAGEVGYGRVTPGGAVPSAGAVGEGL